MTPGPSALHPLQIVGWPCKVAISERGQLGSTLYQTLHDTANWESQNYIKKDAPKYAGKF